MGTYISIIKYYPLNTREEFFGIGIIMFDEKKKESRYKISEERIKRINKFYSVDKSIIITETINNFKDKKFNHNVLNYLSKYENGTIRFSHPKLLNIGSIDEKFDEYYSIYIEDDRKTSGIFHANFRNVIREEFRKDKNIEKQLNIGYTLKKDKLSNLLTSNMEIDFIGGNGNIFCGQVPNLDANKDSTENILNKTLLLYNIFKELYTKNGKYKAEDCKIILKREEKENKKNREIIETIEEWRRTEGYDVIIADNEKEIISKVKEEVSRKDIMPFEKWIEYNPPDQTKCF